jgi:VPDSG-CTERM motif
MKALTKNLLPLTVLTIVVTSLFCVRPAQAYTVRLNEVGANVVANGSGAINLTGLGFFQSGPLNSLLNATFGVIRTGTDGSSADWYTGATGPSTFGSGGQFFPSIGSGDFVGIDGGIGIIFVPLGYVSGGALSSRSTFNNQTFATLGVTPGTYVWSWGQGANQRFTLIIGAVPDGGSTISLLGCALLGLAALRRKLSC